MTSLTLMVGAGFLLWGVTCALTGETEAWNTNAYWAIPVLLAALAAELGFRRGARPLLLGVAGTVGQIAGLVVWHPSLVPTFLPFIVPFFIAVTIPTIVAAKLGSHLRSGRERRLGADRAF